MKRYNRGLRDPRARYRRVKKKGKICHEIDKGAGGGRGGGGDGRVRQKTGVALRGGYTFRVTHRRIAAGTYLRTFIVYELQFRDGSGLIQFNGVPGELYARRHLVPRSAWKYAHTYHTYASVSTRRCVCAHTRASEMYIGAEGRRGKGGGGEGTSTRRA